MQYFIFLMLQVNFLTFIDWFIVSTSVQSDRGRKSPDTSLQGDRGKAPIVPHQVNVKYSNNLLLQQLSFWNFIIYFMILLQYFFF